MIRRDPFPGPGLAIGVRGDITTEKVWADAIYLEEIEQATPSRRLSPR